jgi:hypothetical protein
MGSRFLRHLLLLALAAALAVVVVPSALGSVLVARSATHVRVSVIRDHGVLKALLRFRQHGDERAMLAWGALNARAHPKCGHLQGPLCGPPQVEMSHMRLSPTGHFAQQILRMPNLCKPYDGPKLPYYVAGCEAPDHTYWGVQSWVRLGPVCTPANAGPEELRLSHWSGPVAKLHLFMDWHTPHPHVTDPIHYQHLFGWYDYKGEPVYGLKWDGLGVPLDGYGRVIYIQSHDAQCGDPGEWIHDENGLSKPWEGQTCHTYAPEGSKHFLSAGDWYRAVAMGPGVTPDVGWGPVPALTIFDMFAEQKANELQKKLSKGSKFCNKIH